MVSESACYSDFPIERKDDLSRRQIPPCPAERNDAGLHTAEECGISLFSYYVLFAIYY